MTASWKKLGGGALAATAALAIMAPAADAQQVFWASSGGFGNPGGGAIFTTDLSGGGGVQQVVGGLHRPLGVTVHGGQLYWAEDGHDANTSRIARSNLDGSGVTTIFDGSTSGFTNAQMIAINSGTNQIYWTDYFDGVIRGNIDGTGYQELGGGGTQYTALDLHFGGGHVFYGDPTNNGVIHRMNLDGTGDQQVAGPLTANNWDFNSLVVDQATGDLYFSDAGANSIKRLNHDGGAETTIASGLTAPFGIALHDGQIYWVGGSKLGRVGMDGSNSEILASGISDTAFGVTVIPEPGTYALLFGIFALAAVAVRRRLRK